MKNADLRTKRHPLGPRKPFVASENARLLSAKHAAEYLGMPFKTFRQHAQNGTFPIVKFGDGKRARWYFRRVDLDAAIERHTERVS